MSPRRVNDRARGSPFAERTTTIDTTTLHVCLVCGASFAPKRLRGASKGLYCSKVCAGKAVGRHAHPVDASLHPLLQATGPSPRTGEVRACLRCGAEFYVKPYKARDPKAGRYCSITCRNKHVAIPAEERFWKHVDRRGPGDCWPWMAARDKDGYGLFMLEPGKQIAAHRYRLILAYGPLPENVLSMHTCDNPPCVNIAHLRSGSHQDNVDDMIAKGRAKGRGRWDRPM